MMHSDQCWYCGKWVCHKPLLGTLHFCLPPEEIAQVNRAMLAVAAQKNAQNPYAGPLLGNVARSSAVEPAAHNGLGAGLWGSFQETKAKQ